MIWAVYDPLTGRIDMTRQRSSRVPPRTRGMAILEVDEGVHPDTHYIKDGIAEQRPEMAISVEGTGDELIVIGLPSGADVKIEGADRQAKGRFKIRRNEERHLFVKAFPYRDHYQNLAPHVRSRDAELAKIKDPAVRDFLRKNL